MKICADFLFLLALTVSLCNGDNLTPLLAVSNCDALPKTSMTSGDAHTVLSEVDIEELRVAVVMKATKLSFDDIAKYGGVYGEKNTPLSNIQTFLSTSHSSLSAGVSGYPASDVTTTLSFAMDTKPVVLKDVTELPKLDGTSQQLLVVELPEGSDENTFRQHDAMFAQMKNLLDQASANYAIFYTSDYSSGIPSIKKSYLKQYTQEPAESTGPKCFQVSDLYNYTSCIVFCFTTPQIVYTSENQTITLGNGEAGIRYERGSCNSTESLPEEFQTNTTFAFIMFSVEGNATEGEQPQRRQLVFTFENGTCVSQEGNDEIGCGLWTMRMYAGDDPETLVEYRRNRPNGQIFTKLAIPHSLSYSCGNNSLNKFVSTSNSTSDSYQLGGIQVQAFSKPITNDNNEIVFSTAYQCQGYIDGPLWMGVATVLLLVAILYVSNVAAFSHRSLDMFDDPRAPTISVENLH